MYIFQNLSKVYRAGEVTITALDKVSFTINDGEYVSITGPSGSGKSTVLSILGLLDTGTEGEYWFNGTNVTNWNESKLNQLRRGRIGFIFQSFNLIEQLNVYENVSLALEYTGIPVSERRERVKTMLARLHIEHRSTHRPSQLSGGQQQRVAIARALVAEPALLLADEPTGNLDTTHGNEVMSTLQKVNETGTTIVMVTHSQHHAAQASRTIQLLDGRVLVDAIHA